jgi:hypothetical protein
MGGDVVVVAVVAVRGGVVVGSVEMGCDLADRDATK